MTTEYTKNFRLNLPDFRMGPWHDLVNENTISIDELIQMLYQGVNTVEWTNATVYNPGITAIDPADNSIWVCCVSHTSAATGTFAADRAAHPTYWNRVLVGLSPRGAWKNDTHYLPNDLVTDTPSGIIAVCITEHTSNDHTYLTFLIDLTSDPVQAIEVTYDNTVSAVTARNVQAAIDLLFSHGGGLDEAPTDGQVYGRKSATWSVLTPVIPSTNFPLVDGAASVGASAKYTREDHVHPTDTTRASIAYTDSKVAKGGDNMTGLLLLSGDPTAPLGAVTKQYVDSHTGSTVFVSDSPPGSAPDSSLWFESDTGSLYIKYNDGNSTQWVIVAPSTSAIAISAVTYKAQTPTMAEQTIARQNIYAAPFDALAYSGIQINGSMSVSQELGTAGTTLGSICDGWKLSKQGAMAVIGSQFNVGGVFAGVASSCLAVGVNTPLASLGSTDVVNIFTAIEGYRIARLGWGTANAWPLTVGFWTGHHRTGTYSISFQNAATNRYCVATYTQNVADTAEYKVVTIPGDTAGTWNVDNTIGLYIGFTMANGATPAPSNNVWAAGATQVAAGQVNAVAAASDVFRLTGVVVLPGIEAPSAARAPFIMRPYDQELMLCGRYYNKITVPGAGMVIAAGDNYSTVLALVTFSYPKMRAAPTIALSALTDWALSTGNSNIVLSSFAASPTTQFARMDCTVPSGLITGQGCLLSSQTANATISFDARF
jgi:hypothetical protein